ncbi:uncharacterized protein TNCV_1111081 [Trichonephila clavipes]|nr:uncharacterized protein TNCV_1111081 [Trichonephila clavipes]
MRIGVFPLQTQYIPQKLVSLFSVAPYRRIPIAAGNGGLMLAYHEFTLSTARDPQCRGDRYTLNIKRLKRPPVGVVWMLGVYPNYGKQRLFAVYSKLKNIIDADSDDESGTNNAAPVPTSSEMRNIMKSMRSYLNVHSNGEMNSQMDDIDPFVDNFMLIKTMQKNTSYYFPKTQ